MTPKLVFIGPMGAGKSTVGQAVASRMKWEFTDTDSLIELDQGKTISEIFIEDGEPHFRLVEESVVIDALSEREGVLALGGGAVMSNPVQAALKKTPAKKIFLDISLTAVSPRVGFDTARPLLMVNPRQKWTELMNSRRSIYEDLSDFTIDVSDRSVDEVTDLVLEKIVHL